MVVGTEDGIFVGWRDGEEVWRRVVYVGLVRWVLVVDRDFVMVGGDGTVACWQGEEVWWWW